MESRACRLTSLLVSACVVLGGNVAIARDPEPSSTRVVEAGDLGVGAYGVPQGPSPAEAATIEKACKLVEGWRKSPPSALEPNEVLERVLREALVKGSEGLAGSVESERLRDSRFYDIFAQNRVQGDGLNLGGNVCRLAAPFVKAGVFGGAYRDVLEEMGLPTWKFVAHVGVQQLRDRTLTQIFRVDDDPLKAVSDMVKFGLPTANLDIAAMWIECYNEVRHWTLEKFPIGLAHHLSYVVLALGEKEYPKVLSALRKMDASGQTTGFPALVEKTSKSLEAFLGEINGRPVNVEVARKHFCRGYPKSKTVDRDVVGRSLWMVLQKDKFDAAFYIAAVFPREAKVPNEVLQQLHVGRFGDVIRALIATDEPIKFRLSEWVETANEGFTAPPKGLTDLVGAVVEQCSDAGLFFDCNTAAGPRKEVLAKLVFEVARDEGLTDEQAGELANDFRLAFRTYRGESKAEHAERVWRVVRDPIDKILRKKRLAVQLAAARAVLHK